MRVYFIIVCCILSFTQSCIVQVSLNNGPVFNASQEVVVQEGDHISVSCNYCSYKNYIKYLFKTNLSDYSPLGMLYNENYTTSSIDTSHSFQCCQDDGVWNCSLSTIINVTKHSPNPTECNSTQPLPVTETVTNTETATSTETVTHTETATYTEAVTSTITKSITTMEQQVVPTTVISTRIMTTTIMVTPSPSISDEEQQSASENIYIYQSGEPTLSKNCAENIEFILPVIILTVLLIVTIAVCGFLLIVCRYYHKMKQSYDLKNNEQKL
ncbi:PREDICTED: uncharacterized protein LOC109583734 [Amphimedon queenslandica]|uniref:Immunoglobulin subtype domain-containing protein n=1 Tax=Amphimedon queenslandica TaxID=400682 RepID=A0A1X7UEV2_AMPQE|nr:PREDICTED: uncharacterized protein LOC109583734 [Amphimedon queenslandica]|eukprot:XP_019854739.1 PREDICTED: uncharacterized protein LOC109583734 [Amphimedon queenslandica]